MLRFCTFRFRSIHWCRFLSLTAICLGLLLVSGMVPVARAAGSTWTVTSASDSAADGDLATRTGSLRFALTHAVSGDLVVFGDFGADIIFAASTLSVPPGVAVGRGRGEACGNYNQPLANIEAVTTAVRPVFSLDAGATLRGIAIAGGDQSVKITGDDVDICAAAIGLQYGGDGDVITRPPAHAALVIDGARARIHRSYINGPAVVTTRGSDTVIGDTLDSSGEGNDGVRSATVTVLADATSAAQRVTIRDPFPRALHDLAGSGVAGGDDLANHANNWAQTPTISSAQTSDNFATVQVRGIASPFSLVDIYFDTQLTVTRQAPVVANAAGVFSFSGPLPGATVKVIAASTLNDPAHPQRAGSSSQLSTAVAVTPAAAPPALQVMPQALAFAARPGSTTPLTGALAVLTDTPGRTWQTSVITGTGGDWLAAAPAGGAGDAVITVSVRPEKLATGVYTGTVVVADAVTPTTTATATVTLVVSEPLLAATGSVTNLSSPEEGSIHPGDRVRFTVVMTNAGVIDVTGINSTNLQLPPGAAVISGTGVITGDGTGFIAGDTGFHGGMLGPGSTARYTLDVQVAATARPGTALFSLEVNADGVVSIPVVGRVRITPTPAPTLRAVAWLPLLNVEQST